MGWAIGYDDKWKRDIGYGVPAYCDHPNCTKEIDRGLSYVCGGEPYGGERGCGLFFCEEHRNFLVRLAPLCSRCYRNCLPYKAKPEHPAWIRWKLTDESWEAWRQENPQEVEAMKAVEPPVGEGGVSK